MTGAYKVVDADGHILAPLDLWDRYIDPGFREHRPRFVIDENGKERLSVEGKLLGNPRGIGSLGSVGARQGIVKAGTLKYSEGRWPTTSGRTRSCGPPIIRTRTASSLARRRCSASASGRCPPRPGTRYWPAAPSASTA